MHKLFIGVATFALLATGAIAHEPEPILTIEPAYMPATGFDWDGFYMGLGVTGSSLSNIVTETTGYLDIIAGFNVTSGSVLFGAEAWIGGYSANTGDTGWGGGAAARVGYLISPEALIYLSGGGYFYDAGAQYGTIGAGAEFAVTDNLSIDLEYKYWGWSNNGWTGNSIGVSTNWGF